MIDIELIADGASRLSGFRAGTDKIIDLLHKLERLPEIDQGWTEGSISLSDGDNTFTEKVLKNQGSDVAEFDIYFLVAMAIKSKAIEEKYGESYLLRAQYGIQQPLPTTITFNFIEPLVSLHFVHRLIGVLLEWAQMQHIGVSDMDYRFQFSPVDERRRTVGWAGWVPYKLTSDQVPEAYLVQALHHGTFLACQEVWIPHDHASIERAQALDLRLNSLGVLPTLPELATGNWGEE